MLTPDQIHRRALNRYADFLRSICTGENIFPLNVFGAGLAKPGDFASDRLAIDTLRSHSKEKAGFGYEITWGERTFRRLGTQNVPSAVSFPTQDDYVRFLSKQSEVRRFITDYSLIKSRCPELMKWAQSKPLKVVAQSSFWDELLNVCLYLRANPRPNCYLRELPVIADTKFIEKHAGILTELLPIAAPLTVGPDASCFETRFGFRLKQPLVRMRFLDRKFITQWGLPADEFATPLDQFQTLPFRSNTVLIVENEMTFVTLPPLAGTIALFGAGDAAALLTSVPWLNSCRLFYWGDLDSHGFETLAHLRKTFTIVTSVLMDEATFDAHSHFAVKAAMTRSKQPLELSQVEQSLYDRLIETQLLLEQERIPNRFSEPYLSRLISA